MSKLVFPIKCAGKSLAKYSSLDIKSILKSKTLFVELTNWKLYFLTGAVVMLQVFLNEVPGDARVFYQAGLHVRNGMSPWKESLDPINAQFLNGPIYSFLCFLLTFLGLRGMYWFTCFLTIVLVPITVSFIRDILKFPFSTKILSGISSLVMLSFPVRANLEYGQIVVPYVFLLVLLIYINRSKKSNGISNFFMGLGLILLVDFKPHLFLVWFLVLFRPGKKSLSLGGLLGVVIEVFCLHITTGQIIPIDWFSRLIFRASGSDGLRGYYNLHTLISLAPISSLLSISLALAISLALLIYCLTSSQSKLIIVLYSYLAMFPIFHPQDFYLFFVLIFTLTLQKSDSRFLFLCLGLSFVWSENVVFVLFSSLIIAAAYREVFSNRITSYSSLQVILMIFPSWFLVLISNFQEIPKSFRITANILSIFGFLVLAIIHPSAQKMRNLF